MIRCKFVCYHKETVSYNDGINLSFGPVYTGSPENLDFFLSTPSGELRFFTVNKLVGDQIETGKEYYIDIIPAE